MLSDCTELMREWDWIKNKELGLDPVILKDGSNKKAWWRCLRCGEEWVARIVNRSSKRKTGCPYCCNPPLKPSRNRNLLVLFPDVARQLHPIKNGGLDPQTILPYSNKMLWFVCSNGHEYRMSLPARTKQGQGCPKCNKTVSRIQLRLFAEILRFFSDAELESRRLGPEVDILIPSIRLGIEVDGWRWHKDERKKELDAEKNRVVEGQGYKLLRVRESPLASIGSIDLIYPNAPKDSDILDLIISLFERVSGLVGAKNQYGNPSRFYDNGKYLELLAVRGKIPENKSLGFLFPDVSRFWSEKNDVTPFQVRHGEGRKAWWRCSRGHEFKTAIGNMIVANTRGSPSLGCPYCSGHFATADSNLETENPGLALQWHPVLNGDLKASDVRPKSNKKVWWMCENGHEWQAVVESRFIGCGCPICYGRKSSDLV